jgi:hypothetical protein
MVNIMLITLFLLATVFVVVAIAVSRKSKIGSRYQNELRERWVQVVGLSGDHRDKALLEADKILAKVLELRGFKGSVGEMLKTAKSSFSSLDGVWFAHKLRNKVAHEMGFVPSATDTQKAMSCFRQALQDLGLRL